MPESIQSFVARKKADWDALQALLDRASSRSLTLADVHALDELYRRASFDLAHAQTHYPRTDVTRFLNQLCGTAYRTIYRQRSARIDTLVTFFQQGFPRAVRRELFFLLASAALLCLGGLFGALTVWFDEGNAGLLVPQAVRDSVASGQLWTDHVLSVAPPGVVASGIATNNLSVVVAVFGGGLLLGLGTAALLVFNGAHLGAIVTYCFAHNRGADILGFIAAHGPMELSLIVIAGASGLMLGHALIDPKELPRGARLRERSRQAALLVLGCAPLLALTGLVEGFVSPGALFSAPLKALLGLGLAGLFWAFVALAGRPSPSSAP